MRKIFILFLLLHISALQSMQQGRETTYSDLPVEILYKTAQDQILSDISNAKTLPELDKAWKTSLAKFAQIDKQHKEIVEKIKGEGIFKKEKLSFAKESYLAKRNGILANIKEATKHSNDYSYFNISKDGINARSNIQARSGVGHIPMKGGGMNVTITVRNGTMLMIAVGKGDIDVVKLLIDYGADLNLKDNEGKTALMLAKDPAIAKLLIDSGANVNSHDKNGRTALMLTTNKTIADLLKAKGAI